MFPKEGTIGGNSRKGRADEVTHVGLLGVNHSLCTGKLQWLTGGRLKGNWSVACGEWGGGGGLVCLPDTFFPMGNLNETTLPVPPGTEVTPDTPPPPHNYTIQPLYLDEAFSYFLTRWPDVCATASHCLLGGTGPKLHSNRSLLHGLMCAKGECWISTRSQIQDISSQIRFNDITANAVIHYCNISVNNKGWENWIWAQ